MTKISVIVPTHNPDPTRLGRTLAGLRAQTVPVADWELCIVDNASSNRAQWAPLQLSWHPNGKLVGEERLGLTAARKRGLRETTAGIVVFVDDDNVLEPDYLQRVIARFDEWPDVGALGGRSIPEFETKARPWHQEFIGLLAVRDLGPAARVSAPQQTVRDYPDFAPIGAGMAARRSALDAWLRHAAGITDRRGTDLTSGGDNDIVLCVLKTGRRVAYVPELTLTHLIPAGRLEPAYLARLNRAMQMSWMQVLTRHGVNPWPPISVLSASMRKAKAWFVYKGWKKPAAYVRWQGACGHFDGRVLSRTAIAK